MGRSRGRRQRSPSWCISQLLGSTILDAAGHSLGHVREAAVTPGVRASLVTELIWGRKGELFAVAPGGLEHLSNGSLRLRGDANPRPFNLGEPLLLLDRDLMDQQIIDVHGRKVVRVNDVSLLWLPHGGGRRVACFGSRSRYAGRDAPVTERVLQASGPLKN